MTRVTSVFLNVNNRGAPAVLLIFLMFNLLLFISTTSPFLFEGAGRNECAPSPVWWPQAGVQRQRLPDFLLLWVSWILSSVSFIPRFHGQVHPSWSTWKEKSFSDLLVIDLVVIDFAPEYGGAEGLGLASGMSKVLTSFGICKYSQSVSKYWAYDF